MVEKHLDELDEELKDVSFASVNIDDHPDIAQQFQVRGVPTVYFIKNGRAVDGVVGAGNKSMYRQKIAHISSVV